MTRLLTDTMLGGLTTYLRMCGYDTVYALDVGLEASDAVRTYATAQHRQLLTRNRELAGRTDNALLLESRDTETMLSTLWDEGFELRLSSSPERCGTCNGTVTRVESDARTPAYAPAPHSIAVWVCQDCGQYFWKGSHWDDVAETLEAVRENP
ncbi:Mut7-C RNAse domain-containing protein [Halovenus rubra]|uniref:Mut7-C RNAse domain-containing protein n=2 Tax=Halovenus rubra TaxID=869890 RepID=A0ABD5X1Z9_9EURY|nr:Mut7-C RNAse domain-containing protein [Halovenus rubra]